ncbi:MAG: UDP-N-acetylmuramoyl-L-alanyl-D-glutamate--2,6-diaminopimelate ligase [Verrucomicrobiia bacterium]
MQIKKLIEVLSGAEVDGPVDRDVIAIHYDSRRVTPESLFVALPGLKTDGHKFIEHAVKRGAVAVLVEKPVTAIRRATVIRVPDAREAMARLAAQFHGHPDRRMKVIGITGTNGKTTTAFMVQHILKEAGIKTGLIGTVRYEIGERVIPASRTTPEAVELHEMMAQMVRQNCGAVVMEVSSHSLDQKRVLGIDFDVVVFTNLTQDHLDYHKTMDNYFEAKSILFKSLSSNGKIGMAVINVDDPRGRELVAMPLKAAKLTYGIENEAMVRGRMLAVNCVGLKFEVATPKGEDRISLPLFGRYNVANALGALGACMTLGVKLPTMARALKSLPAVPGRLERVDCGQPFQVFVDYAHTDDALKNMLTTLRESTTKRLLVCFGCGGNRDTRKRELMGRVASQLADFSVLTSDNPRKEEPRAIISQIEEGFSDAGSAGKYEVVEDRREAISRVLAMAEEGDIVVIAGKGHETYQEFADTVISFDDREVAREYLTQCLKNRHSNTPPAPAGGS